MNSKPLSNILLTIGLPVYNGEKSITKSIDSLLNQTFTKFEIIISDNASTDNTEKICKDYVKKDPRIKYFKQSKNIGALKNFSYVLNQSNSKYFMWAADDDLWENTFLEKNIQILESDENIVGSISKVDFFGNSSNRYSKNISFEPVIPAIGNYEERFSTYLKLCESTAIYSIFRTNGLKESTFFHHLPWDLSVILAVLKFGELHVVDQVLFHRSILGESSSRVYPILRNMYGIRKLELCFMFIPFLKWCVDLFGIKFLFKNSISILNLHISGYGRLIYDELSRIKNKVNS